MSIKIRHSDYRNNRENGQEDEYFGEDIVNGSHRSGPRYTPYTRKALRPLFSALAVRNSLLSHRAPARCWLFFSSAFRRSVPALQYADIYSPSVYVEYSQRCTPRASEHAHERRRAEGEIPEISEKILIVQSCNGVVDRS